MSASGVRRLLEITVLACVNLKDTEWISRQDPYVCIEYDKEKFRTRTCTGGGKNPRFQEKFVYTLTDGLQEVTFSVWNSNLLKHDVFIGSGKVYLQKVLSTGFDDSTWPILSKTNRHSGELRLIMHYANANSQKPSENHTPSAPMCSIRLDTPQVPVCPAPPPAAAPYTPPASAPPCQPVSAYLASPPYFSNPCNPAPYPPNPYRAASAYPPQLYKAPSAYPPQPYPPVPQGLLSAYPPEPHIAPSAYPPQLYSPPAQDLPYYPPTSFHSDPSAPTPQGSPYYPAGLSHSDPYILSQKPSENHTPSAPMCSIRLDTPQVPVCPAPPPAVAPYTPPASAPPYFSNPCDPAPYPPNPYRDASAYPPQLYKAPSAYPPQPYPPVPQGSLSAYPPEPHIAPSAYPPQLYSPPAQGLPYYPPTSFHSDPSAPTPQGSPYYPAGRSHSDPCILVIFYVLLLCLFISLLK